MFVVTSGICSQQRNASICVSTALRAVNWLMPLSGWTTWVSKCVLLRTVIS